MAGPALRPSPDSPHRRPPRRGRTGALAGGAGHRARRFAFSLPAAFVALALAVVAAAPVRAAGEGFETTAPTAILIDMQSGDTLFGKNAQERIPPASLAKLMTVAVLFDALDSGEITEETTYTVSEHAWREGGASSGGSTMFLPMDSEVSVGDLIRGIIIQSGNDATIVAAEGLAGSEAAFADRMNALASDIGLSDSNFTNPHGLPDPDQYVTVADLATLAAHIIREYPDRYGVFGEPRFTYNDITQDNRNPLIDDGADGLKTGHTQEAGYGLVASAEENGRRVVLAMSGMGSEAERAEQGLRLMRYGLQDFERVDLIGQGEKVGDVAVREGTAASVPMIAGQGLELLVPTGSMAGLEREISDNGPFQAPIARGQRLGWLRFVRGEETVRTIPLVAGRAVDRQGFLGRIYGTIAGHFTGADAATP